MKEFQRYALGVAIFAAVLYVALVIAAFGFISLAANVDVIGERDAGVVVGPVMVATSAVVVLVSLISIGVRIPPERQRISIGGSVGVGIAALIGYVGIGSAVYAAGRGDPIAFVLFAARNLISPFALGAAALAAIVAFLYMLVLATHVGDNGGPRWPWERRGE
ncbi:DUF6121 family protein [Microbacterium sp. STN6]|uniref:DUF6121 family protein n=1 Tax=Microbacterium sp. STN6 TaxID=2995588 RepID=UPI002260D17C|nr:DUF6121 family protein [Microbacterium sp. STN6]MCX7523194.1 DUF6121 family protein [Microbacterium sp. STN6]